MDQGKVGEEAELRGEDSGNVGEVEVDSGYGDGGFGGVGKVAAEYSFVVADGLTHPIGREVVRVIEDYPFPCLESNVSLLESRVRYVGGGFGGFIRGGYMVVVVVEVGGGVAVVDVLRG